MHYSRSHLIRQRGFTLIELMVALLLSMLLAIALVILQSRLGAQTVRNSDVGVRDVQVRAAMDLITQDLSSAGFLFGGTQNNCNALFTYGNSTITTRHPVDSQSAAGTPTLNFTSTPVLTLNYPPSGSTVPSDILVMNGMNGGQGSTSFNDSTSGVALVLPNSAYTPSSTGVLQVANTTGMTTGDMGVLQVLMNGKMACIRAPIAFTAGTTVITSAGGTMMPATSYAAYNTGAPSPLTAAGFTIAMTDAEILSGTTYLADIGTDPTPLINTPQTTVVYFIDNSGSYPVLKRNTYSLLSDKLISSQDVAAGVVSMQVLFGVDATSSGAITNYYSAATVTTNKQWDLVRSVRVALVARSLINDSDPTYYWAPTAVTPGASAGATSAGSVTPGNGFAAVPVPAGNSSTPGAQRRYIVQQTEIAMRNVLW